MTKSTLEQNLSTSIESLFDQAFPDLPIFLESSIVDRPARALPSLDFHEKDGRFTAELAVPGYDSKDIDVVVNGNVLWISGSHSETDDRRGAKYHRREIRHGSFARSIALPQKVGSDGVSATVEKGILKITMTPSKPLSAKKIEVLSK
jgi:HSP20 family protein